MATDWPGGCNTSDTKPASSTHEGVSRAVCVINTYLDCNISQQFTSASSHTNMRYSKLSNKSATGTIKQLLVMAFAMFIISCGEEKPIEVKKPIETEIPFQKRAEAGDAEAQQELGRMYASGNGVLQDYTEAVKWFRMAAEQGDEKSQFFLAQSYHFGEKVPTDYAKAAKWYRKAAEQGNTHAQTNLGMMYAYGMAVPEDKAEAVKSVRMAADMGDANAKEWLEKNAKEKGE